MIEYLGIILDSDKMEARLPEEKVNHISKLLDTFIVKKYCIKRELLQLLGHINFATRVVIFHIRKSSLQSEFKCTQCSNSFADVAKVNR
jgi:DNA-directed RNA polymerase subunit N (RpoN/RPB10)